MITVVNKHKDDLTGAVNVMRPSPLGNPYLTKSAGGKYERGETIPLYEEWLRGALAGHNSAVINAMNDLWELAQEGDLKLKCCCAPLACHADVIKKVLEEHLS